MDELLKEVESYVFSLLQNKLPATIIYHNYLHTSRVVDRTKELAEGEGVTTKESALLLLAAWLHDVGYVETVKDHEESSVKIAIDFLKGKLDNAEIDTVASLIMTTKMDATPKTPLEKIIKDADFSHLSSTKFEEISDLLKEEFRLTGVADYSYRDWKQGNIEFVSKHQYHTKYAMTHWHQQKQANLLALIKEVEMLDKSKKADKRKKKAQKEKAVRANLPEKGVETMFRVTLRNHIKLSDIADTKANILLSVNAILISIALSSLVPRLDNPSNEHLIIPTVILITFSVVSVVFAIQSTRPKVTEGKFSKEDVANKKANLLFFGNFHGVPLEDFSWGMKEMMRDKDYLYDSMIKDLYFLGIILHKKYKLLRITYTIFTIGILISVFAFFLAFFRLSNS